MILTCPACDTKYVVKDGAIPPGGRQVRCASCRHSWHQDPDGIFTEVQPDPLSDLGGPPPPSPEAEPEPFAEIPAEAQADMMVAEAPQPDVKDEEEADWEAVADPVPSQPAAGTWEPNHQPAVGEMAAMETADWHEPDPKQAEEFIGYSPIGDEERPRNRWLLLLGLIVLIIVAAAAFWFLAPTEWKTRAGIAQAGQTPLQLMITTSDRQPLESGNELVAISGRVINPTDMEQNVPPIRAELRDKQTHTVIYRWTIAPPARVLAPRSSASFNSAEVDVPKGGDELTVTLGG